VCLNRGAFPHVFFCSGNLMRHHVNILAQAICVPWLDSSNNQPIYFEDLEPEEALCKTLDVPCYHYINEKSECVAEDSTEPLDMELCTDVDGNMPTEYIPPEISINETECGFYNCPPRVACLDDVEPIESIEGNESINSDSSSSSSTIPMQSLDPITPLAIEEEELTLPAASAEEEEESESESESEESSSDEEESSSSEDESSAEDEEE
jgi:hypothetical protein